MRFRRQLPGCQPDGTQYMLFLLDTSGSIGSTDFERMKVAISKLIGLFCKPTKFAVMTFSHRFNLEFCFNCHENTCDGRKEISKAISDITYRGGATYTAGATKCVHEDLLSASCGLDAQANCISVVYITDGKSNDPTLQVCQEIQHLRNSLGVQTFAIGIDNYDENEIQCIGQTATSMSVFRYESFDEFVERLDDIIEMLLFPPNPSQRQCSNHLGEPLPGDPCL